MSEVILLAVVSLLSGDLDSCIGCHALSGPIKGIYGYLELIFVSPRRRLPTTATLSDGGARPEMAKESGYLAVGLIEKIPYL
jgi:hypothetical protein